jgi:hypothetical protein
MNKYAGGALALAALAGIFYFANNRAVFGPGNNASSTGLNFPLIPSTLSFPTLDATPVGMEAWSVWQRYLSATNSHDLETVRSFSHQLSPTCADPDKKTECDELMDSAYFFGSGFKQADFTNVVYDDKQIILSTNYLTIEGVDDPTKIVIYFTRTNTGPKVLGMRFCFGEESEEGQCVQTDREKRDQDRDGWWDDVEELFK